MPEALRKSCRRGSLDLFRKPKTSDPFVNAQLTSLGTGPGGVERFWISTINQLAGPTSVLIGENGRHRLYKWPAPMGFGFFYGAAPADSDTVWLAGVGRGTFFVRLTLSSGKWKRYKTPVGYFITAGMALDRPIGKLFCGVGGAMVSFNTKTRKFARIYKREEMGPDRFHYDHWRNRDGTYGFLMTTPGLTCLRWDPSGERIEWKRLIDDPYHPALKTLLLSQHKYTRAGNVYVPHVGWLDGISGKITPHEHPPRAEANWFGRRGQYVLGIRTDTASGDGEFLRWDTRTGDVEGLFTQPDVPAQNCALTRSGKILAITQHGIFRRFDAQTGLLELTRNVDIENPHPVRTITPASRDVVVGTPFICQNFWILNTRTGKGFEAGRAAGLYGQIDNAISLNGKVYFSAYGGAQLTEYDPSRHANWPRNPRLVASNRQGQHGAGMTTDGRIVWCAYRPKYGTLDGAMTRYDTLTGAASYKYAEIKNEHIVTPMYDPKTGQLVAGSSFLSDCATAVPTRTRCYAVTLDPSTMRVTKRVTAPKGVQTLTNIGPLGNRKWLMRTGADGSLLVLDEGHRTLSEAADFRPPPGGCREILYAGVEGLFVMNLHDELRLWDALRDSYELLARQRSDFVHRAWVHGKSVYCDCGRDVAVFSNVLRGRRKQK